MRQKRYGTFIQANSDLQDTEAYDIFGYSNDFLNMGFIQSFTGKSMEIQRSCEICHRDFEVEEVIVRRHSNSREALCIPCFKNKLSHVNIKKMQNDLEKIILKRRKVAKKLLETYKYRIIATQL